MVTIKDVSHAAGVSNATVSKVLNGDYSKVSLETKENILRVAKELNYTPNRFARALVRKKSLFIGMIVSDISNPYFIDVYKGAMSEAERFGYQILLCEAREQQMLDTNYVSQIVGCTDGIILATSHEPSVRAMVKIVADYRVPYVLVGNPIRELPFSIYVDDFMGEYMATQYLIENGHKNIAFIGGEDCSDTGYHQRLNGFRNAMQAFRLQIQQELVLHGSYTLKSGLDLTTELLDRKTPFTALLCGNDLIAMGAIRVLHSHGYRIPQDISIIGYDDTYLADIVDPSLTTVKQPSHLVGAEVMRMLQQRIDHPETPPFNRTFPPSLVIRGTVKTLNA